MRWLQWSKQDLENGLGGVEAHARSLRRELLALGIDAQLSSDPRVLGENWDVIQTHGSSDLPSRKTTSIRVHTLHGTTLGRMSACGEWFWPGGYAAYAREIRGILQSRVVLGVHPDLHLLKWAHSIGRVTRVCSNGWDQAVSAQELPEPLKTRVREFGPSVCFIGRGDDQVKNTDLLSAAFGLNPSLRLIAVPGAGFEKMPEEQLLRTERLAPEQVVSLMDQRQALVLCSKYEGLPLVALEALTRGVPVISTRVGGLKSLPSDLKGLRFVEQHAEAWAHAIREAMAAPHHDRAAAAAWNQSRLPRWQEVARVAVEAVSGGF